MILPYFECPFTCFVGVALTNIRFYVVLIWHVSLFGYKFELFCFLDAGLNCWKNNIWRNLTKNDYEKHSENLRRISSGKQEGKELCG